MHPTLPGRQRTSRTEPTKQKILEAAACLLAEKGYGATSLDDVAAAAGVSKGTIYYNFNSKEEIYWHVVFPQVRASLDRIEEVRGEGLSPKEAIRKLVLQMVHRAQDPRQRYMYFQELLPLNDDMRKALREIERAYEHGLADIIKEGQQTGEVNDGDPHLMALITIGAVARTARWYDPGGRVGPEEFERTLLNLLLSGLFVDGQGGPSPIA